MKPIPLSSPIKIFYKSLPNTSLLWPILDIDITYKGKSFPQKILSLVAFVLILRELFPCLPKEAMVNVREHCEGEIIRVLFRYGFSE